MYRLKKKKIITSFFSQIHTYQTQTLLISNEVENSFKHLK